MVKIFLFHRVSPFRDILWDPMDIPLFEKCIQYISSKYHVVLLEDLMMKRLKPEQAGKKKACIVFDDGYKDNIEYAAPILCKYNIQASFYVVTDCIDKNIPTWTHQLDYAFQFTNTSAVNLAYDFLPVELQIKSLTDKKDRIEFVRKLKPALKKVTHEERQIVMNAVLDAFKDIEMPRFMMNWDDLRLLKKLGHYIGSHTVNHVMLGTMIHKESIKSELVNSGEKIKNELGYFPLTISYPVGSYNETTIQLSKEAGYEIGLAVKQKVYNPKKDNVFEIPRIELYNESWFKTRLRINNIIATVSKILKRS